MLVVTHGAFTHFLTEDWEVEDPMLGTAWKNCKWSPQLRVGHG